MFLILISLCYSEILINKNSSRLILNNQFEIYYCLFYNLGSLINQGGAIYKSGSFFLKIFYCSFHLCTSENNGGALYILDNSTLLNFNCFYKCFIRLSIDNYFGNCFYINSFSKFNFSSSLLCGYSVSTCSDSSFFFTIKQVDSNNINCSNCYSNGGASGILYDFINTLSTINYLNVDKGIAAHAICFHSALNVQMNYINFINQQSNELWWTHYSGISVNHCFIFNCNYNKVFSHNIPTFTNSFSDQIIPGFVLSSFITYNLLKITYDNCLNHFKYPNTFKNNYINLNFLLISYYLI